MMLFLCFAYLSLRISTLAERQGELDVGLSTDRPETAIKSDENQDVKEASSEQMSKPPISMHVNVNMGGETTSMTGAGVQSTSMTGAGAPSDLLRDRVERRAWNTQIHSFLDCDMSQCVQKERKLHRCCEFCLFLKKGRRLPDGTYPDLSAEDAKIVSHEILDEFFANVYDDISGLYDTFKKMGPTETTLLFNSFESNHFALLAFWELQSTWAPSTPLPGPEQLRQQMESILPGILVRVSNTWRHEMHDQNRAGLARKYRAYMTEDWATNSSSLAQTMMEDDSAMMTGNCRKTPEYPSNW